jgi:hypothetical protein
MRFDSLNEIRDWKMIQRFHHMLCVMARQRGQPANEATSKQLLMSSSISIHRRNLL